MPDEELHDPDLEFEQGHDDEGEMPWESAAREAIESALQDCKYDEIREVIYASVGEDQRGDPTTEEFGSVDELLEKLIEIGEEQWYAYVPYDEGPVFEADVDGLAQNILANRGIDVFFESIKRPEEGDEIVTAHDLVLPEGGLILQGDLGEINDELIRYLAMHPEQMHEMAPRKFEELVAALFRAKGYEVVLTPATRDGGVDMRAFHRGAVGTFLTMIECKRYNPNKRVSVDIVRGLYGVTESEGANLGLVVTTSSFTRDAKSFQAQNKYRIQLADQADLQTWLREHRKP